ncbi:MAG: HAMP domain-containing protein [Ignavibacteriales bacterium]|nr:HAMP domain-containing protein [Ignavibacteriales bacterium]
MQFFHSIRTKLTLWYTAMLGITLLGFGGTAYLFTRTTLSENLDRSLHNEVKWVNEFIEPQAKKIRLKRGAIQELQQLKQSVTPAETENPDDQEAAIDEIWNQIYQHTLLSPRRQYIQILDRNGDLLYRSPSLGKQTLQFNDIPYRTIKIVNIENTEGRPFRLAITQNDYVKIFVAYPLQELNDVLDDMFSNFRILAPIALLVSIIGGWFLAHKSLKPVDTITKTAREISAKNLTQQLPAHNVDDELGRLTATFNAMITRLNESFAQIQRFSADASHELRTPLTIMRGEIEVALRNKRLPNPTRELLMSVHDELVRLSSIVESLMTLIKSETGRLVFQFDNVSLDTMIQEIAEDTQVLGEKKKIKVEVKSLGTVNIHGDAVRLRQLFLNLAENAVKYTPPRGKITLSLSRVNGNAVVDVQDTGIGIARKDLPKIFNRFYRVKREGTGAVDGSGLGLAIAQWIAEAHHGTIQVQSQPRKGSTFTVTLPLS